MSVSLGNPDRRGSRSAKRRFSNGARDLVLPLDTPTLPTTDFPPRTPPKTARIEATQKIVKSQEKASKPSSSTPFSPPKSVIVPKSPSVLEKTPSKVAPPQKPSSSKKRPISPTTPAPLASTSSKDEFSFGFPEKTVGYAPTPPKIEKVRSPLPMPVLAAMPPSDPVPVIVSAPTLPAISTVAPIPTATRTPVLYSVEPFFAEREPSSPRPRVLFALTGSVATIKLNELLRLLSEFSDVIVVTTKSAEHFVTDHGSAEVDGVRFYNDQSEYAMWHARNDPVLHIELRKWADIFLIAPLSANTLAKIANGLCDNLVTSIARAWDFERPFYVAPAMNTLMWTHPFTQKHLNVLTQELGISILPPVQKTLMCGDKGTHIFYRIKD